MEIELLFVLQELEAREAELEKNMKRMPQFKELKAIKQRFESNRKKLEDKKDRLAQLAQNLNGLDDRARTLEERQQEIGRLLYNGSVQNPKELENMQQQLAASEVQLSKINDEILSQMELKEELEIQLRSMTRELQDLYQEFNKLKVQYNRARINLEQEILGVREDKDETASHLNGKWLVWYREHKEKFGGNPVSKVLENHACSGCRTVVSAVIVRQARENPGEVFCENCGRLLYAPSIS